jgi:hypothetical protein
VAPQGISDGERGSKAIDLYAISWDILGNPHELWSTPHNGKVSLETRIKRLAHKTIYFSKLIQMHDIVIGLFVNRFASGRAVYICPLPLVKHYPYR